MMRVRTEVSPPAFSCAGCPDIMRRMNMRLPAAGLILGLFTGVAAAQTLEMRAGDAAVQELIEKVLAVRVASGRSLSSELAPVPPVERELRDRIAAGCRRGAPRPLPDGSTAVDASLEPSALTAMLREAISAQLPKADPARWAVDAATVVLVGTGVAADDGQSRDARPGWRHCTPSQIAAATRAAELDLHEKLRSRLAPLQFPGGQRLGDLFALHMVFDEAVRRQIAGVKAGSALLTPGGLCIRSVRLTRREIIRLLTQATDESPERIGADPRQLTDAGFDDPMIVDGYAVAPPSEPSRPAAGGTAAPERPAWAERFLTARGTGQSPPEVGDREQRRALASRVARMEATLQIWREVDALPLPGGTTIGETAARHPDLAAAIQGAAVAIVPTTALTFDAEDTASITLGLRLQAVWDVIQRTPAR